MKCEVHMRVVKQRSRPQGIELHAAESTRGVGGRGFRFCAGV